MTNPLIEKYNELYKPKVEKPKPEPKPEPSYPKENRLAIHKLEILLEDLKTGMAIYQDHKIELNYRCMPPITPFDFGQPHISPRYLSVYEGDLFTFKIFRRHR